MQRRIFYILLLMPVLLFQHCKKPYEPVLKNTTSSFLVVSGVINTDGGGITTIQLSRSRSLSDTITFYPEHNAAVVLKAKSGGQFILVENNGTGNYTSQPLSLGTGDQYQLIIQSSDGEEFASDYVSNTATPPIDSISWSQDDKNNLNLFLNTHDPADASRYYWWEYTETWEYKTALETIYGVANKHIYQLDSADQIHTCWISKESNQLLVGTSEALTHDVISMYPLATIPNKDERLYYRYSILLRQYTLPVAAYRYWDIIKKNSSQLGTLFDRQPSQLVGNIHSVTHPDNPVIGYLVAAGVQQKRIFIKNEELRDWAFDPLLGKNCAIGYVGQDPNDFTFYDYPDINYRPWYFVSGGAIAVALTTCLDCRTAGGNNHAPSFW